MKTKIHAFFLFALAVLFAASAGWAEEVSLLSDGQGGYYTNLPFHQTNYLNLTAEYITENNITSFTVYDDGGEDGSYSSCRQSETCDGPDNKAHSYLVITAPAGYVLQVNGWVHVEAKMYDNLTIYDGTTESTMLLEQEGNASGGAAVEFGPFETSTNVMAVEFIADYSGANEGFALSVELVEVPDAHEVSVAQVDGVVLQETPEPKMVGETVSLAFEIDAGYVISDVSVSGGEHDYPSVFGTSGTTATVAFTMPNTDVTVTPTVSRIYSIAVPTVPRGHVESDAEQAIAGTTVHLTAVPEGEGAQLVRFRVIDSDGQVVAVNTSGNTGSFTMPDNNVIVRADFANPTVVTFDENGCLDNGTYFHLVCSGETCTLSQGIQTNPNEGVTDFRCWYLGTAGNDGEEVCEDDEETGENICNMVYPEKGVVDIIQENESMGLTLRLGTSLNLGGYDESTASCALKTFEPISLSMESTEGTFDGMSNTVTGFCFVSTTDNIGGFVTGAKTIQDVTFDNAHVVVNNASRGSKVGVLTATMDAQESSISNVHVTNSYVAGTQVGAFVGDVAIYHYREISFDVTNSSVENTKVYGLNAATGVPAAGGFVGYASDNASLRFTQATVSVTTPGAGLVADDASYVGTYESYRGGFVGYQSNGDSIVVSQATVSGLSVSGGQGVSNVGAIVGSAQGLHIENSNFENITVSGSFAGGIAGYVGASDHGQWYASNVTLTGTNSVTGSSVAGGLLGVGSFWATDTEGDKEASFEVIQAAVNVSGQNSVGGLVGRIANATDARTSVNVAGVSVVGNVVSSTANMASEIGVGGLIGYMSLQGAPDWDDYAAMGAFTMMGASFEGDISFTNTGATQNTLYMGPLFGAANGIDPVTIFGSFSNGNITYSGVDAANAEVGYLGGYFEATDENAQIIGNYHYGPDAIKTGLGNIAEATWKKGGGAFQANVRNAATGLTADGEIGLYGYKVYNHDTYSWGGYDLFEADLSGNVVARVSNGVASEDDMKSMKFAALMNFVQENAGDPIAPTWVAEGGSLPAVTDMSGKRNYLVMLYAREFSAMENSDMPLTVEELNSLGIISLGANFNETDDELQGGTGLEYAELAGFWGYTDANGHVNSEFVNKLRAVDRALTDKGYAYTTDYDGLITTSSVFTSSAHIRLDVGDLKTYAVEYQDCTSEECAVIGNTGNMYGFLSPKVQEIHNNESAYTTLVPLAFIYNGRNTELVMALSFQGDDNTEYGSFDISGFTMFSDALSFLETLDQHENVTKFVVKYREGTIPKAYFKKSSEDAFDLDLYVYDNTADEQLRVATSSELPTETENFDKLYGAGFQISNYSERVGYTYDSYSVSFTVSNKGHLVPGPRDPELVACDEQNPIVYANPVNLEGKNLPSYDVMLGKVQDGCQGATWTVSGLGDEDMFDLTNARLLKTKGNAFIEDTFTIVPKYVAKPYNIVFNFDGHKEEYGSEYVLFVQDDYNDPENPQKLDNENLKFPMFLGTTGMNTSIRVSGWTLKQDYANCVLYDDGCSSNAIGTTYSSLTPEFITAATDAGLIDESQDVPTIQLYPIWIRGTNFTSKNFVKVNNNVVHGEDFYESPIIFTLSQETTINGTPVTLTGTSKVLYNYSTDGDPYVYGVLFYQYGQSGYTANFAYEPTPGFNVTAVSGYDTEDNTISVYGTNKIINVSYDVLKYNVDFSLENVDDDVYLGHSWTSSKTMSYEMGYYKFPNVYVRDPHTIAYGTPYWGVKTADGYEGHSKTFDSKLVGMFLKEGYEYYTPAATPNENASVGVYAIEIIESASSTTYGVPKDLNVYAVDDEGEYLTGDASYYHGSLVLTQTYDNDADDVHLSFEHASWYKDGRHLLYIPDNDDTLAFTVSARPDPGYIMTIEPQFDYTERTVAVTLVHDGTINWGYNASTGELNVQPVAMNSMSFNVHYTQLFYDVSFDRPTQESGLFVGNKYVDGEFQTDWLDGASDVTVETIHAPALYNAAGCRVGWKVRGREAGPRETTDIVSEIPYMTPVGGEVSVRNALELDAEHMVENECGDTYQLTLDVEGMGDVYFIQKIGDAPVGDDDPEQTIITHAFVSADENLPLTLTVPKVVDATGREVGVKLTVVAVPASGYMLNALSYDVMFNGNTVTILAQDSTELNIMENQAWHVKFNQYSPGHAGRVAARRRSRRNGLYYG